MVSGPGGEPRRGPGVGASVAGGAVTLSAAAGAVWAAVTADAQWHRAVAGACAAAVVLLVAGVLVLTRRLSTERAHRAREAGVAAARRWPGRAPDSGWKVCRDR